MAAHQQAGRHEHDAGGGHGHGHGLLAPHGIDGGDARRLAIALALILAFMAVEVATGVLAHSLALLSDAAHMLTDAAAIGLSLLAARLAQRPARGAMTYGLGRVEALAAQANGVTLLVLAAFIVYEAVRRLIAPPHVRAGLILAIALAGVLVNIAASLTLAGAGRRSINLEGSFQHVLTDLYAFIGTAVAAVVILATGFERADPIASLLVAALMLRGSYGLLRASARVFLEAAPEGLDVDAIGNALAARPGVVEVHDLHVWELGSGFPSLSAHVLVGLDVDCHAARGDLATLLRERFGIAHSTLQVEHSAGELLEIQPAPDAR
jgi:cobalt-zinc-cadmium efflux system protein